MPGKITLEIVEGPKKGVRFSFDEHDTFLFGRAPDCHVNLPHDSFVSRYHFILEANPPQASLKDLGSLNGTFVNNAKHGGKKVIALGEDTASSEQVVLCHGDRIQVGKTVFSIAMEAPEATLRLVVCSNCGEKLPGEGNVLASKFVLCDQCRASAPTRHDGRDRLGNSKASSIGQEREQLAGAMEGYDIENMLGKGGMGVVYRVRRKRDGAALALKVIRANTAEKVASRDVFMREVGVLRSLRNRHIVAFVDSGEIEGAFYIVMEYCNRGNVARLLEKRNGTVALDLAGAIIEQSLRGLAYAHRKKFVHRDLKPHNILLDGTNQEWRAKLGDFGLAKSFDRAGLSGLTATGSFGGTLNYMPREQLTNYKYLQPTSDVWSLGAILYRMVSGSPPRTAREGQDPIQAVLNNDVVPLRERMPQLPELLLKVVDKALAVDVDARYPTASEFRADFQRALQSISTR